ncbi:SusC/RagA family TonB-linked outer membrane protein [Sunxiuqinia sp. A32]|uniref:SusC/RagA family TonB-linked outer membrane protein n=1 Tax=Sunxiuqinia sp. A32 TaxID=3461496 RepID=UPI0040458B56
MHNLHKIISRKIFLLALIIFSIGLATSHGQEMGVSNLGVVLDSYGNPVANVEIQINGSSEKATSNQSGHFELNAKPGDVITFTHPDFYIAEKKVKTTIETDEAVEFYLVEKYLKDPEDLDVLYGSVNKDEYLGAASTIYTDQLSSTLSNTLISSFAGRLAGLYTEQYGGFRSPATTANATLDLGGWIPVSGIGAPTDNTQFNINSRGMGPVVIVDGIQRELFSLDPENIESVSIQKDALSSVLLGMRSSRGVLLITTKKPTDEKFRLSFTGRYGVQSSINTPDALPADQYAYLLNEALQNDGMNPAYSYEDYEAFKNGTNPIVNPSNDWYKTAMRESAPITSYNLNISGGTKRARYYVSLGYFNQESLFRTSDENTYNTNLELDRYLITSKLDVDVTNELQLGVTIIGRIEEGNQPGAGYSNILSNIYATPNSAYPITNPDGSYGGNVSFTNNILSQTINSGYYSDNTRDAMANIDLKYDLGKYLKGLTFKAITNISTQNRGAINRSKSALVYGYEVSEEDGSISYAPFGGLSPQANSFSAVSNSRYWFGQVSFDYQTQIGKHKIEGTLLADKQVISLNYDLPMRPTNISLRGKYNYDQKYFVEAAVNRSFYNGYKPGEQWGTFYAVGLGWDIKKENFLDDAEWLDKLKLRAVYGETGNGIENSGYYIWRQSFRQSPTDYTYSHGSGRGFSYATIDNAPLANMNITWEKARKLNIGADISMFSNHLTITGDYYRDNYYDLLQIRGKDIALMGFAYPPENIGEKLFKGGELSVTYQNNIGNFNYFVTANWGQNATEVLYIDEQYKQEEYNKVTGKPNGAWFGLVADGFFNSVEEIEQSAVIQGFDIIPGDVKYKDLNNDGVINQYDHTMIAFDKPLSYYGVTLGFNFHGIDFNVLLQGVYNRDLYLGDDILMAGFQGFGQSYGQAYTHMIDRWTPETMETAKFPRLSAGGNTYNTNPNYWATSLWVKSGNYLRVKDINLAYTLPESLTKRFMGGARVKLFVSGQNVFTQADCDLVDPEVTNFRNYPNQRVLSSGINIKF